LLVSKWGLEFAELDCADCPSEWRHWEENQDVIFKAQDSTRIKSRQPERGPNGIIARLAYTG